MQQPGSHEDIHMPKPSPAPIIVAAGLTLSMVGLLSQPLLMIGLPTLALGIGLWVFMRD